MKARLTVLILSVVSLVISYSAAAAPPQGGGDPQPYCLGPICDGEYTVFPLPGWTVNTFYHNDGQALTSDCEPCDGCSMNVKYEYQGSYLVLVTYPGGSDRDPQGSFDVTNVCDGIAPFEEFANFDGQTKVASFQGNLTCPCVPE